MDNTYKQMVLTVAISGSILYGLSLLKPKAEGSEYFKYTVMAGDTLSNIAENFGVHISDIMEVNPSIVDPNLIYTGQKIVIPKEKSTSPEVQSYEYSIGNYAQKVWGL